MFPRGGDEDWGNGIYFFPDTLSVNIYTIGKEKFGTLKRNQIGGYFYLKNKDGNQISFSQEDIEWVTYYTFSLLKFKNYKDSQYVKVFWKSIEGGLLIKKEDLNLFRAKPYTYEEVLFKKDMPQQLIANRRGWGMYNLGINLNKSCLNLRVQPNVNSVKIRCVRGNDWGDNKVTHIKVIEYKNQWAKIEIFTAAHRKEPNGWSDCPEIELGIETGWVKAIDDTGFPNIWFPVTSY
jgi:hypothetical protein